MLTNLIIGIFSLLLACHSAFYVLRSPVIAFVCLAEISAGVYFIIAAIGSASK